MLEELEPYASALALPAPPAAPLRHAAMLAPLGIPTRFEADSDTLLAAAIAAYGEPGPLVEGHGVALGTAPASRHATPRVLLLTAPHGPGAGPPQPAGPLRISADRESLLLAAPDAAGRARRTDMTAIARLAPVLLADADRLRAVLDALVLFLITALDRQPVHAAAIARGGAGLVLAGPGGIGKSTLAYAALRAGLAVLGDDAVYVQLAGTFRVWGLGRPIHLAPEAARWFPELATRPAVLRANGKRRIVVSGQPAPAALAPGQAEGSRAPALEAGRTPPPELVRPAVRQAPPLERAGLCLLEREAGSATASAEPIAPGEAVSRLVASLDPGFDVWRDTIGARIAALARGGAWRLRVGDDPRAAVPVTRELLDRVSR
ncbi:MAG TPA: hypothetical protein VF192_16330 [Longimicrobiales bacterium]